MVVYNKKVSKRRRKRTGSKRKITKPRNKRMNRSRQMGGARPALQALTEPEVRLLNAADQAANDAELVDLAATRQATPASYQPGGPVNQAQATERAADVRGMVTMGVANQQALCDSIKGAISNLIRRVKDCDTVNDLDLTELAQVLDTILNNVERLQGHCDGLGDLLIMLERRLLAAGCLDHDAAGNFNARVTSIDPAHAAGRQQQQQQPRPQQVGQPQEGELLLQPRQGQRRQPQSLNLSQRRGSAQQSVAVRPAEGEGAGEDELLLQSQPLNPQSVQKAAEPQPMPEPDPGSR